MTCEEKKNQVRGNFVSKQRRENAFYNKEQILFSAIRRSYAICRGRSFLICVMMEKTINKTSHGSCHFINLTANIRWINRLGGSHTLLKACEWYFLHLLFNKTQQLNQSIDASYGRNDTHFCDLCILNMYPHFVVICMHMKWMCAAVKIQPV